MNFTLQFNYTYKPKGSKQKVEKLKEFQLTINNDKSIIIYEIESDDIHLHIPYEKLSVLTLLFASYEFYDEGNPKLKVLQNEKQITTLDYHVFFDTYNKTIWNDIIDFLMCIKLKTIHGEPEDR